MSKVFSQLRVCRLLCVDEFKGRLDEVLSNTALGDEIDDRKEQEGPVGGAMVGNIRIPILAPFSPKICEHLEVIL